MAKSPADRPSQVQTQDLTESRINEDFVFWLKKNGSNYLLVVLLAACAALGYNYWQRKQIEKSSVAWEELGQATIPESLDEVAKAHANVPQVAMIAELSAGDRRLAQIRSGELTPKQGDTPAVLLDEATRKITQDAADANYTKAADIAVKLANGSREQAITVVLPTLFGRAAVAESRGDFEGSRKLLEEAAALAGSRWPGYEKLAKWRANETLTLATAVPLPTAAQLPVKTTTPVAPAGGGDDLFQQLIQEQATQGAAGETPAETPAPAPAPAPEPGSGG
jgi:predicted negative regulator of RcsB-dependent stress response